MHLRWGDGKAPALAWRLGVPLGEVSWPPREGATTGVVIVRTGGRVDSDLASNPHVALAARGASWAVWVLGDCPTLLNA
ncbi:MAG: hypothetical protein U5R31_07325 [Acidimicrobiia bacterium]|nr:hypothetical protein [Acidimicrobiia bacterium]